MLHAGRQMRPPKHGGDQSLDKPPLDEGFLPLYFCQQHIDKMIKKCKVIRWSFSNKINIQNKRPNYNLGLTSWKVYPLEKPRGNKKKKVELLGLKSKSSELQLLVLAMMYGFCGIMNYVARVHLEFFKKNTHTKEAPDGPTKL